MCAYYANCSHWSPLGSRGSVIWISSQASSIYLKVQEEKLKKMFWEKTLPWDVKVLWSEFHPRRYLLLAFECPRKTMSTLKSIRKTMSTLKSMRETESTLKSMRETMSMGKTWRNFFSRKHFCEVLWLEFHPCRCPLLAFPWYYLEETLTSDHLEVYKTSCPYIWKSTRNTWEARSSDLNFLPSLLAPHCHEENYVPLRVHEEKRLKHDYCMGNELSAW